ncbi:ParB/RepB/Spo0J family partition protein [Streptomyces sp. bgisy082]|uniref:ParB/RepB/Spo0J family partition protein n=1 Tax=Streptomyces sp. bgisy082 TaxID=3413776 RepID=UPI003D728921
MTRLIDEQPVAEVISWPERPRHNPTQAVRLRESLVRYGVEQPITVVCRDEYLQRLPRQANSVPRRFSYVAISDYHWLEAARTLGLSHVPVWVRCMPPDSIAAFVLRRHGYDDHLGPLDEARLLDAALNAPGQTESQNAFARRLGWSPTTVSHRLALLRLLPDQQAALEDGRLSLAEARKLLTTPRSPKVSVPQAFSSLASR